MIARGLRLVCLLGLSVAVATADEAAKPLCDYGAGGGLYEAD